MYKKKLKKSPGYITERVKAALKELSENPRPETLGPLKKGELRYFRSYELGRSHRLIYKVNKDSEPVEVILLKVCSHKDAYGTD